MTTHIIEGTKDYPKKVEIEGEATPICCPLAGDPKPWCTTYVTGSCGPDNCPVKVVTK